MIKKIERPPLTSVMKQEFARQLRYAQPSTVISRDSRKGILSRNLNGNTDRIALVETLSGSSPEGALRVMV